MSVYVLDSNFFIQAHRAYYPMDVAPGFWAKVRQLSEEGKVISIDKVKKELYDKNDELEEWCRNNLPADFFKDTSGLVLTTYPQVTRWAMSRRDHYNQGAVNKFLDADEADAFLIAYCYADAANRFIVTQEVSQPNRKNEVKIPEACNALNIRYVNAIGMFRALKEKF